MTQTRSTGSPGTTFDPREQVPRVLIVDDRPENLLALEAVLAPLDVEIVRASSGGDAISRCGDEEFAVVILDVMMPGVDGHETARHLKARGASRLTPIIFLTAVDADRRRVHDGYASGAVDYLFKPVDPDLLRDKVMAFVDLFRHRRSEHWQQRRRYADQAAELAAAAYREGDQRFQLLAESVPAMVWTADANGRVDFMNAFGAAYVGVPIAHVRRWQWSRHLHPDDVASIRQLWKTAVRSGDPYEADVRIWSVERNEWRRHLARAVARRDEDGTLVGWIGVNTDVEDSIRAEAEAHALQLTAERRARLESEDARVELGRAVDRFARLQSLTAALSQAATPAEVAHVVVKNGVSALGAAAGVIAILDASGATNNGVPALRVIESLGYAEELMTRWQVIPIEADVPLAEAVRTGRAVLIASKEEMQSFTAFERTPIAHAAAYSLPLVAQGNVIGAMGLSFSAAPVLSDDDRALADAIAHQCAQALHRAELFDAERRAREEAETARQRVAFLSEAGAALNESLDYHETLQAVADAAVPFLADFALVDIVRPDGIVERMTHASIDPALGAGLNRSRGLMQGRPDPTDPTHACLLSGESCLIAHVDDAVMQRIARNTGHLEVIRSTGLSSIMAVPLKARSRMVGVVVLCRRGASRAYSATDLRLAEDLARRAAVAIDTASLYEEAQEANRAKAAFLAAVSHDLRQPLNASLGFLDIALMGLRGEVGLSLREDLERVRRNQQHLLALINDVLSFARIEAGQLVVRREIVPLGHVLEALPALVSPQADAKGVSLRIAACPSTLGIVGDRDRVVQVFTNLLTNAIKATPAGGTVSIDCDPAGDVVLARVRDTGVGIPAEMRDRIFEPFVQVTRSLSRPEDGIGLGLSISRNLARAMGGELTVDSAMGEGSVFTVRLPRAPLLSPSPSAAGMAAQL